VTIRFIVGRKDEDSHVERGIFQAAAQALERQNVTGSDADELDELLACCGSAGGLAAGSSNLRVS
jgi:hypothetical protein